MEGSSFCIPFVLAALPAVTRKKVLPPKKVKHSGSNFLPQKLAAMKESGYYVRFKILL